MISVNFFRGFRMGRAPWTTRTTVEDCPVEMRTTWYHRDGIFKLSPGASWISSWWLNPTHFMGKLTLEITSTSAFHRGLYIPPQLFNFNGHSLMGNGQRIPLSRTRPHFGGSRVWFICECGRQSGKLHLPDGQTVFRCRRCYNLTYRSSQQHSKKWDAIRAYF
jgi:hypothetical protein